MSGRQQSPADTTGTSLRPRVRRLISIEGDDNDTEYEQSSSTSNNINYSTSASNSAVANSSSTSLRTAVNSALAGTSRGQSPSPAAHLSRGSGGGTSVSQRGAQTGANARTWGLDIPAAASGPPHGKSQSIWTSSWSSIQGVASTLLGSNLEPSTPLTPGGGSSRRKAKHGRNYSVSVPEEPWGPAGKPEDLLATGSKEDRLARVQAEKRKVLLAGVGDEQRDALGRYKRRTSLDRADSIPSPTQGDDALVYLHQIKPGDSVAGLSIRYNCAQAVVRKANGLWASDSIQLKKLAYLPVDACAIRGQKVSSPRQSNVDLLAGTEDETEEGGLQASNGNGNADYHISSFSTFSRLPTDPLSTGDTTEKEWTHDSWVLLPHSSTPIEIGRMPRRTLGFFPPARRKSITAYTDTSPSQSLVSNEAPSNAAPSLIASARTSPGRGISPARRPTNRLGRSNSSASRLNPHARLASSFLRGPGGVGSLHSNIRGPAPDELNRFVAQHMPQLIIQGDEVDGAFGGELGNMPRRGPMPLSGLSQQGGGGRRLSFDRASIASGSTAGTGVEAVAGAVEGWMRKVGGRVKGSLGTPEMRGSRAGRDGGDLIELVEGWDLNGATAPLGGGAPDSWESEGHGVVEDAPTPTTVTPATASLNGKGRSSSKPRSRGTTLVSVTSSARDEEERLLRERFPPAGKVFEEQGKKRS